MSAFAGNPQSLQLQPGLWLVPLLPLLILAGRAVPRIRLSLPRVAGATLIATTAMAAGFAHASTAGGLLASGWSVQLLGTSTHSFSLIGRPLELAVIGGLSLGGALLVWREQRDRAIGAVALGLCGAALAVLAATWVTLAVGGAVSSLALAGYCSDRRRELLLPYAGELAVGSAGVALCLWALNGTFDDGYTPTLRPRLTALTMPATDANGGTLTLTALAGSRVSVGGAPVCALSASGKRGGIGRRSAPCARVATAPFIDLPIPTARQNIVVHTGDGTNDLRLLRVRVDREERTVIAPLGEAFEFAAFHDQFGFRDVERDEPVIEHALEQELRGVHVPRIAWAWLVLAAALGAYRLARAWAADPAARALIGLGAVTVLVPAYRFRALAELCTPLIVWAGVGFGLLAAAAGFWRAKSKARPVASPRVPGVVDELLTGVFGVVSDTEADHELSRQERGRGR